MRAGPAIVAAGAAGPGPGVQDESIPLPPAARAEALPTRAGGHRRAFRGIDRRRSGALARRDPGVVERPSPAAGGRGGGEAQRPRRRADAPVTAAGAGPRPWRGAGAPPALDGVTAS